MSELAESYSGHKRQCTTAKLAGLNLKQNHSIQNLPGKSSPEHNHKLIMDMLSIVCGPPDS